MSKRKKNVIRAAKGQHVDPNTLQEKIRTLAYHLYRQCGCESGHDLQHWLEAEQRILGRPDGERGTNKQ